MDFHFVLKPKTAASFEVSVNVLLGVGRQESRTGQKRT